MVVKYEKTVIGKIEENEVEDEIHPDENHSDDNTIHCNTEQNVGIPIVD